MKKLGLIICLAGICLNGCGDTDFNSVWHTQNIIIDGSDSDWDSSLVALDKINASAGIENDNDYLYLCLSCSDPEIINKIVGSGLTLWFQSKENGSEKFGIRFPMGMNDAEMPDPGEANQRPDDDVRPGGKHFNPAGMQQVMLNRQKDVEIINSNNNKIRIPLSGLKDIQVKTAINDGKLVYEMKMPLNQKNSSTYALNTIPGSTIRIGFESGTADIGNRPGNMPAPGGFDMPPGGDEGPGGGPGGEPGGAPSGGPDDGGFGQRGMGRSMFSSQSFNFWINVKLAENNKTEK